MRPNLSLGSLRSDHIAGAFFIVFAIIVFAGCTASEDGTVEGEVSFDGRPVPGGYVTLLPADGHGAAASGPIVNGRYRVSGVAPVSSVALISAPSSISTRTISGRFTAAAWCSGVR